jgi:lactoylglutathione lyase
MLVITRPSAMTMHPIHSPIARIDRLVLRTSQLERLRAFYGGLLGADVSPMYPRSGDTRGILLDFCGVDLELVERPERHCGEQGREPSAASLVFALGSADAVDQLTAQLAAAGHIVTEQPRRGPGGCYASTVLDPDGNHVGLTV